jgi:hypothetical protein
MTRLPMSIGTQARMYSPSPSTSSTSCLPNRCLMPHPAIWNCCMDDCLTNRFSKTIPDRGRLRHYDGILRKYLLTLKGGIDSYLAYENRRVILYLKWRRPSTTWPPLSNRRWMKIFTPHTFDFIFMVISLSICGDHKIKA